MVESYLPMGHGRALRGGCIALELVAEGGRERQLVDVVEGGAFHHGAAAEFLQGYHCRRENNKTMQN